MLSGIVVYCAPMTAILIALIVVLTCMFIGALLYVDHLRRDTQELLNSERRRVTALQDEARNSTRWLIDFMEKTGNDRAQDQVAVHAMTREMQRQWFEQLRAMTTSQANALNSAVKTAFAPAGSPVDAQGNPLDSTPYQMPVPTWAKEGSREDMERDPTDGYISDGPLGDRAHVGAIIADDNDLFKDGMYLGIPGLEPPPGLLDLTTAVAR